VKKNVDSLKLIQVGVTICDHEGKYPSDVATWQFNLKFDLNLDKYSSESIALLTNSGINFELLAHKGIPIEKFGEYIITSGLLLNEDLYWISFHGVYDFAYLLKVITGLPLPETENLFFEQLKLYFPHYYDIRYLVRYTDNLRGSLSKLGQELNVNRIGIQHQAGSDSIITSEIFFKLKAEYFSDDIIRGDKNILFGMGVEGDDNEPYFNPGLYGLNAPYSNYPSTLPHTSNGSSNKFNSANYSNIDYTSSFYPQSIYGLQYNILQPKTNLGNNTNFFPHAMTNLNLYQFPYTQNNLNGVNNINNLNNYAAYNIQMGNKIGQSGINLNSTNSSSSEEKKKYT